MTRDKIIAMQTKIGTTPDGFWGPQSIAACQRYLRQMMPTPHPFPPQANVTQFYGPHGVPNGYTPPMRTIQLPFTVYFENSPKRSLRVHERCADSLLRVFNRLAQAFPTTEERRAAGILTFDGLYNPRLMRNSSTAWSMHSWAIAIDFDAARNGNQTHWPTRAVMPLEVMECFAAEGWTPAGAFWGRDAMHFQATAP
ncbi:MAG: M15 family metallopeptidase [Prosthecobacter sp.]|nr:M15 family metallopeptidase [Prosthecobacter sp.]